MTEEIWKDIPGYEGHYQVSSLGKVKSLRRPMNGNVVKIMKERIMVFGVHKYGYHTAALTKLSKNKTFMVHRLVIDAFEGLIEGLVVDHINNIKTDNRYVNLQQVTNRQNCSKDHKNKTSIYTGVCWCKSREKWQGQIYVNNKTEFLGRFDTEEKASEAYQNRLKEVQDAEKHRFNR